MNTLRCTRCHRPLKRATESGMGSVCLRKSGAKPIPVHERDLFGFIPRLAAEAAMARLLVQVEIHAAAERHAVRMEFAAARRRLGVRL